MRKIRIQAVALLPAVLALVTTTALAQDALKIAEENPIGEVGIATDQRNPCVAVAASGEILVGFIAVDTKVPRFAVSRSSDGGKTFAEAVATSETTDNPSYGDGDRPRAEFTSAESALFLWHDRGLGTQDHDLKVSTTTDGGKSFLRRVELSSGRDDAYQGGADLVLMADGRVVAAWIDWRAGRQEARIYAAITEDAGVDWTTFEDPWAVPVSARTDLSFAVDAREKVFLTYRGVTEDGQHDPQWMKVDVPRKGTKVKSKSPDTVVKDGERWRVDPIAGPAGAALTDTGDVGCLWREGGEGKGRILFAHSKNRGANWLKPVEVGSVPDSEPDHPQLLVLASGDLLALWEGGSSSNPRVYLTRSKDLGLTWGAVQQIPGEQISFATARLDGHLVAVLQRPASSSEKRIHLLTFE